MRGVIVGIGIAGLVGACALTFAACRDDSPTVQGCRNIPAGGCPRSRGLACTDPACEAVYLCNEDGSWTLDRECPKRAPGPDAATSATSDAAAPPVDAGFVVPPGAYGGPGCPTLQSPDCALGTALACGKSCCGCEDFFVCESGGWVGWGYCGDAGPVKSGR